MPFKSSSKNILVIEDDVTIQNNIQEILELEGFHVMTAEDGLEGIKLAQETNPALIICDVTMPKLSGYDVIEQLRQNPATKMIPFIFLTAKAERNDVRHGMNLGADDYLTKPFDLSELVEAVKIRLERHSLVMQHYEAERDRATLLEQKASQNQDFAEVKDELLQKLSQDLRDPISNISIAIRMLKSAASDAERDRYLTVLQQECAREIALLNEISNLQKLLTPENAKLLRRLNLLKSPADKTGADDNSFL